MANKISKQIETRRKKIIKGLLSRDPKNVKFCVLGAGHGGLAMGVAGGSKSDITQAKDHAAVGHTVEIFHILAHRQRDTAVTRLDGFDFSTQKRGKTIGLDVPGNCSLSIDVCH